MAIYKYPQFVAKSDSAAFDTLHPPGAKAPYPGIYRCHGCGHEVSSSLAHVLPPQNHHQHTVAQGAIQWRLIVTHS